MPVHEREQWWRALLDGGLAKLERRTDGTDRALKEAQAKIGELTMEPELVEMLLENDKGARSGCRAYSSHPTRVLARLC